MSFKRFSVWHGTCSREGTVGGFARVDTVGGCAPVKLRGGIGNELGSDSRQLEAVQRKGEGTVGQAHGRSARHDQRTARSVGREGPGSVRHRQGGGGTAG